MEQDVSMPGSKAELIERIRQARTALESALEPLGPEQLTAIGPEGWSIKDHLAHIAAWQEILLGMMHGLPGHETLGVTEEVYPNLELDEVNAMMHERERGRSLDDALLHFRQVYGQVLSELERLPEADLWQTIPYNNLTLMDEVINNTYNHDREHLEWIRRDFLS